MRLARYKGDLRDALGPARRKGSTIGLVPTMGALHEGHLSLVTLAAQRCDVLVVSVFVNPMQFGKGEDFEAYPRDAEGDLELLEGAGVDLAFLPSLEEMYPPGASVRVTAGPLGEGLEGADRSGHFDGVCTVVAKLFNMVEPAIAVFGQKDAQQVAVVRAMVRDLDFEVEIVAGPTVRERDGLALSSRNAYLSKEERARATTLYRALQAGAAVLHASGSAREAEDAMDEILADTQGVDVSYARVVDPDSFRAPSPQGPMLLAVAARVGATRLIDNLLMEAR